MAGGNIYVCTVGTGTAGEKSNVAEGIMAAIRHSSPPRCVLVSSSSPESIAVAEIVREGVSGDRVAEIKMISSHDDISMCRREIRSIIRGIKASSPDAIAVNPTSGTKQMTAAAVMAAVEEGISGIEFITGPRKDGVIITGQERISRVDASSIIAAATARSAVSLIESGSYDGAYRLLEPLKPLFPNACHLSCALGWWHRFAYQKAKAELDRIKERGSESLSRSRTALMRLQNSPNPSTERAADMMNFARRSLDFGHVEEALAVLYRCVESLARLQLRERFSVDETTPVEQFRAKGFDVDGRLLSKIERSADASNTFNISTSFDLMAVGPRGAVSNIYSKLRGDSRMWRILQFRNQTRYGHDTKSADAGAVESLYQRVLDASEADWHGMDRLRDAFKFPETHEIIGKEIDDA